MTASAVERDLSDEDVASLLDGREGSDAGEVLEPERRQSEWVEKAAREIAAGLSAAIARRAALEATEIGMGVRLPVPPPRTARVVGATGSALPAIRAGERGVAAPVDVAAAGWRERIVRPVFGFGLAAL